MVIESQGAPGYDSRDSRHRECDSQLVSVATTAVLYTWGKVDRLPLSAYYIQVKFMWLQERRSVDSFSNDIN